MSDLLHSDDELRLRELLPEGKRHFWDRLSQEWKDFYVDLAADMNMHWAIAAFMVAENEGAHAN